MEIAAIEYDQIPRTHTYKHSWIQILYMIASTICFIIEVYQRISVDLFYASYTNSNIHVPSLNRYPTEFTASYTSISYIWYLVFIWQTIWIIYSFVGIFRRTSSGFYFYQYPCAMNQWAFFYTALALIQYIPQLLAGADNTYYGLISSFRYICTLIIVIFIFIIVNSTLQDNMRGYLRDKYFFDIWLARLLYQNGLAVWASILFYESCLSLIIRMIYIGDHSSSTACITGGSFFLIGLFWLISIEGFGYNKSFTFILSHWLIFFWLINDIYFLSNNKMSKSICGKILVPFSYALIWFFIIVRLRLLCLFYKEKKLSTLHSGRVYSLIVPPTRAF